MNEMKVAETFSTLGAAVPVVHAVNRPTRIHNTRVDKHSELIGRARLFSTSDTSVAHPHLRALYHVTEPIRTRIAGEMVHFFQ